MARVVEPLRSELIEKMTADMSSTPAAPTRYAAAEGANKEVAGWWLDRVAVAINERIDEHGGPGASARSATPIED